MYLKRKTSTGTTKNTSIQILCNRAKYKYKYILLLLLLTENGTRTCQTFISRYECDHDIGTKYFLSHFPSPWLKKSKTLSWFKFPTTLKPFWTYINKNLSRWMFPLCWGWVFASTRVVQITGSFAQESWQSGIGDGLTNWGLDCNNECWSDLLQWIRSWAKRQNAWFNGWSPLTGHFSRSICWFTSSNKLLIRQSHSSNSLH